MTRSQDNRGGALACKMHAFFGPFFLTDGATLFGIGSSSSASSSSSSSLSLLPPPLSLFLTCLSSLSTPLLPLLALPSSSSSSPSTSFWLAGTLWLAATATSPPSPSPR